MKNYLVVSICEKTKKRSFKLKLNEFYVWVDKKHQIVMFLKMNGLKLAFETIVKNEYLELTVKSYNFITKK